MTRNRTRIRSIAPASVGVWLVAAILAPAAGAFDFIGAKNFNLPQDETHVGDLYAAGESVDVSGTVDGDLVVGAGTVNVFGTVIGDLIAGGSLVTVGGNVGEAARLAGSQVTVSGTIEGDLLMFGSVITLSPGAKVMGDLLTFGAQVRIDGDVDGDVITNAQMVWLGGDVGGELSGTAGRILISGSVAQDVKVKVDTLELDESASIGGNLEYSSREPVEGLEDLGVVAGSIDYQKTEKKAQSERSKYTPWWFFSRLVAFAAALLTGLILVRLFPKQASAIGNAVGEQPLQSFGVGFVIAIVLPVGAVIVGLAIVTIPLAIITLMLYLIGWYFAKYPVALWLGRTLLGFAGMANPSPYLALSVGLFPLVVLFQAPYLRWLIWGITIVVGMGAMFLGLQARARGQSARGDGAPGLVAPTTPTSSPA